MELVALLALAFAGEPVVETRAQVCDQVQEALRDVSPLVRRGRVVVQACVWVPGSRVAVVLAGEDGDPVRQALGPGERRRPKLEAALGRAEQVVFAADTGDDLGLVRALLAPWEPIALAPRPALGAVDVLMAAPVPADDDPILVAARRASGVKIRVFTAEALIRERDAVRAEMAGSLPLDSLTITRLMEAGALGLDDVAAMDARPLASVLEVPETDAQAVVDAAALWSEYEAAAGGPRRGW